VGNTKGTWLPGDMRGYVQRGAILPPNPSLLKHAKGIMLGAPVYFSRPQIIVLDHAIVSACDEFDYTLTDLSIESWYAHWIVAHGFDAVKTMVGRLKTRMRQAIQRGRIWTKGYCHRCLETEEEVAIASRYIARHDGARIVNGKRVTPVEDDHPDVYGPPAEPGADRSGRRHSDRGQRP